MWKWNENDKKVVCAENPEFENISRKMFYDKIYQCWKSKGSSLDQRGGRTPSQKTMAHDAPGMPQMWRLEKTVMNLKIRVRKRVRKWFKSKAELK